MCHKHECGHASHHGHCEKHHHHSGCTCECHGHESKPGDAEHQHHPEHSCCGKDRHPGHGEGESLHKLHTAIEELSDRITKLEQQ